MSINQLKKIWADGDKAVNAWCAIPSFFTAEIIANQDFDSVTIDMQHGVVHYDTLMPMLVAVGNKVTPIVRIPWLEEGIIMKVLDAGALGVICPMVNTAADAKRFVEAMRYPPDGQRSSGPIRASVIYPDNYQQIANQECLAIAMIETKQALDNLDEILSTKGLDAIYIGPSDLSCSLGFKPGLDRTEKEVIDTMLMILDKTHTANLKVATHALTPQYAYKLFQQGFDLVSLASDAIFLKTQTQQNLNQLRNLLDSNT